MKPIHVIYHSSCPDGFTSLWVTSLRYGKSNIIPLEGVYGKPMPEIPDGADVIICDFSYSREETEALAARSNSLRIFDHHSTAQKELEGLDCAVFDMGRSGAGITWDELMDGRPTTYDDGNMVISIENNQKLYLEFNPGSGRPWFIDYVEDRDLWRFAVPNSEEVGAFMMTLEHDLDSFNEVAQLKVSEMIKLGEGALRMRQAFTRQVTQYSQWVKMGGRAFPIVNVSYPVASETATALMNHHEFDMAGYWFTLANGQTKYGFASRNGVTVDTFAEQFDGGGHKERSGCVTAEPEHTVITL